MVKFNSVIDSIKLEMAKSTKTLSVGIFDEKVLEYALANEFGTEHIPQRSFLRSTMADERENVVREYIKAYQQTKDFDMALHTAGEYLKNRIQARILEGDFTPNAPSTIKRKGSNHPLIDTGTMLNSIDYVVR